MINKMNYDSTEETEKHIKDVSDELQSFAITWELKKNIILIIPKYTTLQ